MYTHLRALQKVAKTPIVWLTPEKSFDYWMYERRVKALASGLAKLTVAELQHKWGEVRELYEPDLPQAVPETKEELVEGLKGRVHRVGNGWPSALRRWCTRQKVNGIYTYTKTVPGAAQWVGYSADETHRIQKPTRNLKRYNPNHHFPLAEWGVTETDALEYCKSRGFDWGGLYQYFPRVSCFCCPLQRVGTLKKIREQFPDLWARMLRMDAAIPNHNRGFKNYFTLHDYERRFAAEERRELEQTRLFA